MYFVNLVWLFVALIATQDVFAAPAPQRPRPTRTRTTTSPTSTRTTTTTSPTTTTTPTTTTSPTTTKTTTTTSPTSTASTCITSGTVETLSVSASKPSNAVLVPGDFVGFGFETAFLNDYANTFSENLVNSVASRLGQTLIIRIGGTSGDRVLYDPNQSAVKVCISGDCPVGSGATYILGPSYFNGFSSFQSQHFTFQAPLNRVVNTTGALDYVTNAYSAIGASRVAAIALGNEPDDNSGYTVQNYVGNATALEALINTNLSLGGQQIFEALDYSTGANGGFTVQAAFQDGIDSNGKIKYAAEHWYQTPTSVTTYTPETLQHYLMNHSAIVAKFNNGYLAGLQYVEANYPSVSYVLSETGSALAGPPNTFQDGFGACLWEADFNFYSMSLGVKRIDATQRPAAPHSLWVPDTSANNAGSETNIGPEVRGPYYATPMVADFLGTGSGSIVEVLGQDLLTAYALYNTSNGALSKVALLNLVYWSADTNSMGSRANTTFNIPVPSGVTSVTVKRLQASYGAHALGYDVQGTAGIITWAGETWSYSLDNGAGHLVAGVSTSQTVSVCNGVASIIMPDSEGAIVYIPPAGS